jgi:hypothetical protein
LAHFFFGGGDEDDGYGDGGAAAGLIFRPVGSPDFKYSSMACWGVLVEVDLSSWTGGGFGFLPSKTTPAGRRGRWCKVNLAVIPKSVRLFMPIFPAF